MVLLGTFVLYGVSFAVAFAVFALGRILAGSAFEVRDRLAPFGEAPPSGFERARPGARLAITLAGPLGVYLFAALLFTIGLLLGAPRGAGTTVVEAIAGAPAATAGLRAGDHIKSVAGRRVATPADLRDVLAATAGTSVEVVIARDSQEIRLAVRLDETRRLGVRLGPNDERIGVGQAVREGVASPARVVVGAVAALADRAKVDVMGPVGMTTWSARQSMFADRLIGVGSAESIGVVFFLLGSLALWPPRVLRGAAPAIAATVAPPASAADAAGRPILRFLARGIDLSLITFVAAGLAAPALRALLSFSWLPLEALLLCTWGSTPGKWLLGIAVRNAQGGRPTFGSAFRRTAVVWAYGTGADTPFALATGVLAYAGLKRTRTTYWDTLVGTTVHHRPIGAARTAVAVVVLLGTLVAATLVGATGSPLT